ncbi:hypothetical protein [Terribacillus saccharophilus]|uniref:hypothetical protein n=1 Tax=Terribacillus saccharophilus TaxID=361277 RepID=UPI0039826021
MGYIRKYDKKNPNPFSASRNDNHSQVTHSGNADVDVKVEVDTMPIAYAMLCSLLATKQLSEHEFNNAVRKLKNLVYDDLELDNDYDNDPETAKIYQIK